MIGIGEYRIGSFPMMTIGLGSCIGLTFYDDTVKVGAMVHIMLPDSAGRMIEMDGLAVYQQRPLIGLCRSGQHRDTSHRHDSQSA